MVTGQEKHKRLICATFIYKLTYQEKINRDEKLRRIKVM